VYTEEAVKGLLFGGVDLGVEIHGFVNLEYFAFRRDPAHPDNSFDIHNVYLSTKAHPSPAVTLFAELEYEHGSAVKLDRAFLDFEIGRELTLRAGRFSAPLSYERVHYAAPVRLMTSRPFSAEVAFHEWVDTGVEAFGRIGWVGYSLAVLNGPRGLTAAGIPAVDVTSSHGSKTVLARLNAYAAPFLEAGVAGSAGAYDSRGRRWFYLAEVDARIRAGRLDVWAEADYRTGDDEPCSAATQVGCEPTFVGERARKLGAYVVAGYAAVQGAPLAHYLKPVLRFDEIRDLAERSGKRRATAGLDWSPQPHVVLKSELQWTFPFGQPGRPRIVGFMASAVADF
jgi:hypothetical protein